MALSVEVDIVGGCIAEAKAQKAVSGGVEVGRWWVGQGDLRGQLLQPCLHWPLHSPWEALAPNSKPGSAL